MGLEDADKFYIIADGTFGEEIKSSLGLFKGKTGISQPGIEKVTFLPILGDIDRSSLDSGHQPLHDSRGIDEAEDPVAKKEPGGQGAEIVGIGIQGQEANALSGKGELFRIGVGNDAVFIKWKNRRYHRIIINNFTVGFIGNQVDGMTDFSRFSFQQFSHFLDLGFRKDGPTGIVG